MAHLRESLKALNIKCKVFTRIEVLYLICNLSIPLKEQHSKEEGHKCQEAKEPDVVLPPLGLLTIPAMAFTLEHPDSH